MDDQIEIISDGDGIAVLGEPRAVEQFLRSEGLSDELTSAGSELPLSVLGSLGQVTAAGMASSGRWVQLTEESAAIARNFPLMRNSDTGLMMGIARSTTGQTNHILQFASVGSMLNPTTIASIGTMMNQMALQKSIDELADYLAEIDEKVEDVLRNQQDAVLADMIGVDFVIDDAVTGRASSGRVDEATWSKIQGTSATLARTQAYALRQLDGLANKLEKKMKLGELADATEAIQPKVREWLAVIAHCLQLQDTLDVLELDRVLEAAPEDATQKRLALRAIRDNRMARISSSTGALIERMDSAVARANSKVLLQPLPARAVVRASNEVGSAVGQFHQRVGLESGHTGQDAKRWLEAVGEFRDKAIDEGTDGLEAARTFGSSALGRARVATGRLAAEFAERALRGTNGSENVEPVRPKDEEPTHLDG
ncbi:hypothetical protein [Curtobacterium flaccumfaciens]|uniref:hypothetical protein n=1 Tax=Curtobacterium flaccumfaciens TaxID=2035 RepID=UPI001BDF2C8F|nr:hypothetical protein [Curtobacterium flaccumfaciens]MBT1632088.1 hypothetical protein [Curtobacterium flaccumfaciens pv. oortii]MCX2843287.1 hypothetical protein [Curtobacterium flaccumfaciens pv. oortii]